MNNHHQKFADKSKRAPVVGALVVLLGVIFNLTCTEPATAGKGNDLNGDGKADVFWHNSVSGQVAVWLMNGVSLAATVFPGKTSTDWQIQ